MQLDEEIGPIAKEKTREAIENADYGIDMTTYRNKAGLKLLEDRDEMKERMEKLENQMLQFADHKAQIDRLERLIDILTVDAEKYHGRHLGYRRQHAHAPHH